MLFTLATSCLTTSNLPWNTDLTFQVPMQYCSLEHQTLLPITSHIHKWVLFLLWLHLFTLSGVIPPLISRSILGTYPPGEFIFQCPIFLPFTLFMGFSRQECWNGLPFPSAVDHIFVRTSTMTPHGIAHSFIELDKAVDHVIRLSSFLWLCFSVCLSGADNVLGKYGQGHKRTISTSRESHAGSAYGIIDFTQPTWKCPCNLVVCCLCATFMCDPRRMQHP